MHPPLHICSLACRSTNVILGLTSQHGDSNRCRSFVRLLERSIERVISYYNCWSNSLVYLSQPHFTIDFTTPLAFNQPFLVGVSVFSSFSRLFYFHAWMVDLRTVYLNLPDQCQNFHFLLPHPQTVPLTSPLILKPTRIHIDH